MERKIPTGLWIAGGLLLGITALCVVTGIGLISWLRIEAPSVHYFTSDDVRATASEQIIADADEVEKVALTLAIGDITVKSSENDQITLDITKTAYGNDEEMATTNLDYIYLEQTKEGKTLEFVYKETGEYGVFTIRERPDSIDVTISLPKGIELDLETSTGTILLDTYQGDVSLTNRFGTVEVRDLTGELEAKSSSAEMFLSNIQAGDGLVKVESQFGNIEAEEIEAGSIEFENNSGGITVTDMNVDGTCTVDSEYNEVALTTFSCGSLELKANSSTIELTDGNVAGLVNIDADFGSIDLENVQALSYQFAADNADISADHLGGEVDVEGRFGEVKLSSDRETVLNIDNENGNIFFAGPLSSEMPHSITSRFGKIDMRIPKESALNIELKTEYGEITTDFPVTVEGTINNRRIEGQINGGGSLLTIETESGNISLEYNN